MNISLLWAQLWSASIIKTNGPLIKFLKNCSINTKSRLWVQKRGNAAVSLGIWGDVAIHGFLLFMRYHGLWCTGYCDSIEFSPSFRYKPQTDWQSLASRVIKLNLCVLLHPRRFWLNITEIKQFTGSNNLLLLLFRENSHPVCCLVASWITFQIQSS